MNKKRNKSSGKQYYFDVFGLTEEKLRKVIAVAMSKGGDYADLFFENTKYNHLSLEDKEVNSAFSQVDFGVGIRVIKGEQTGFAYSEDLTLAKMSKAARMAASIANEKTNFVPAKLRDMKAKNHYPVVQAWEDISVHQKVPFIQRLNETIFALDEKVSKVNISFHDSVSEILFYNSDSLFFTDYSPVSSLGVHCIMKKGSRIENAYAGRSYKMGFEFLNDALIKELAQEAISKTNFLFTAGKPKAGEMPVVMGAGGSGILLHEAIGHTFEADFNRKKTSIFSDKMGQKVAKDFVNIVDDGTIMHNRGSINFDDEGNQSQKTYLIKDGVLNSYLHDRISAKYYGVKPTGNGRRESFRSYPLPRMRATYMENGNSHFEDLLKSVKYGVFVDNFSNGEVKIGAGDFTFFAKSGYVIENGKLTKAVKDINIIGNGPQALADIEMAANDYQMDNGAWTCGKDGQSVPVTCGLPSVLVKKLTVGGTN